MVTGVEILAYVMEDNSPGDYLFAAGVFIASALVLKVFKFVIIGKLKKITAKTKTEIDDLLLRIIDNMGWRFYLLLSLYIALKFITVPAFLDKYLSYVLLVVFTFYIVKGTQNLIDYWTHNASIKRQQEAEDADTSVIDLLGKISKGVLWFVAVLLILSNIGYDISALVAGLGIGGIAVAFALQNVLSDIFSSFSIYFDKPFKIGDFIIIGDDLGVVKKIGIKSTRLESLWGPEIVISNRELTSTRITNYKKMEKRRILFSFGVVYRTKTEKLKKILKIINDIFDGIELAELNRAHFKEFGDFSLKFDVAYYVGTGDYNQYMDIQQEINLALKERFEKEGIEFAYPTQRVFVDKTE